MAQGGVISAHGRAVICIQRRASVAPEKQLRACAQYCNEAGYIFAALIKHDDCHEAADLIAAGLVDIAIVAFGGEELAELVAAVGGRVEAIHPEPHVVTPRRHAARTVTDLIVRIYRQCRSVREVADLTEETTAEIRSILRKAGITPPKS